MPRIHVQLDERALAAAADTVRLIGKSLNRDVLVPAVNDTVKEVATSTKNPKSVLKQITDKVNIKAAAVRKLIEVDRASGRRPTGTITLSATKRLSVKEFGLTELTRGGIRYKIAKRKGGITRLPHGFIPKSDTTGGHAFLRLGIKKVMSKGRYQGKVREVIGKLHGPSAWGVFVLAGGPEIAAADAAQRLTKNVDQRLNFLLLKAQGKI